MRKKLIASAAAVAIALVLLLPLSMKMERAKSHADQTAEALVKPVLDIHNQVLADAAQAGTAVGGLIELEDAWAIEDIREESWDPLVTQMVNGGDVLGFDRESNTFYCTLGMENGDTWPDIHLTVPGAKDIEVCFVDDYTYDWCADAISEGYPYQIIDYNDEFFSYAQIVFTGLPVVRMTTQEEIPAHVDVAGGLTMSFGGGRELESYMRAHKRGATTLRDKEKNGYKVELTRGADGSRKTKMQVDGIGYTDEFVMLSCVADYEMMRDRLSWDLYNMMEDRSATMGARNLYYCELFVNNRYQGVSLVFVPFDYEA